MLLVHCSYAIRTLLSCSYRLLGVHCEPKFLEELRALAPLAIQRVRVGVSSVPHVVTDACKGGAQAYKSCTPKRTPKSTPKSAPTSTLNLVLPGLAPARSSTLAVLSTRAERSFCEILDSGRALQPSDAVQNVRSKGVLPVENTHMVMEREE
jgi:hypothetical protein